MLFDINTIEEGRVLGKFQSARMSHVDGKRILQL
jgi:hypothetical protein